MAEEFQCYVLFEKLPRINSMGLRDFTSSLEPEREEICEVSEFENSPDSKAESLATVTCGDLEVALELNASSAPEAVMQATVDVAGLSQAEQEKLRNLRAHILCTCRPSEGSSPMECLCLLLKVGMALCAQGGLAVANPGNSTCFTAKPMLAYAHHARNEMPDVGFADYEPAGEPAESSLWAGLRAEGEPGALIVGFLPVEVDDSLWFFSVGHALFGLPELATPTGYDQDVDEVEEHFRGIFSWMYQHGAISPGEGPDQPEKLSMYDFEPLPDDRKDLEGACGTLVVKVRPSPGSEPTDPGMLI